MTSTAIRQTFRAGAPPAGADPASAAGLYSLRVAAIWQAFRRQPISFWLVSLYMLFEYVRPQAIYPALQSVPWAQIFILGTPIAFVLEGARFRARNPLNFWMGAFSAAVLLSWLFAINPGVSQEKMFIYVNWVLVYFLVANIAVTETRFFLFFGLFLLASLKMSQHGARTWVERGFSFADWGATGAPGWFHNSGEFGIQMCIFFPLSLYFIGALREHWQPWKRTLMLALPVTAMMSLIATNSRGALLGVAVVGMWMLYRTRHRVRAFVGLGFLTAIVILVMPPKQRERFTKMGDDNTSQSRITYWKNGIEAFKSHPVTGIGYENWQTYYVATYGRTVLPHNIFIQAGAELGSIGLIALGGLLVASFVVNRRTRKIAHALGPRGRFMEMTARGLDGAMIGYIASGFFVTVLYYPYLWFALGLTAALHAAAHNAAAMSAGPVVRSPTQVPVRGNGWRSLASQPHSRSTAVVAPHRARLG